MPLHDRSSIEDALNGDIYSASAIDRPPPKYQMPAGELRADVAAALVRDELLLDGNARQNLSTFCQTCLDREIHELMDLAIDKNMIDKDEHPATAEIESRCVRILAASCRAAEPARLFARIGDALDLRHQDPAGFRQPSLAAIGVELFD